MKFCFLSKKKKGELDIEREIERERNRERDTEREKDYLYLPNAKKRFSSRYPPR